MRVFAIGDVISRPGCEFLSQGLRRYRREQNIDLCIVNAENSAPGNGLTADSARQLFDAGADVLTSGNHVFQKREAYDYLEECQYLLRPANFAPACPGRGSLVLEVGRTPVLIANLSGRVYLEADSSPFAAADHILKEVDPAVKVRIFDFHAEATSEKIAMAYYLSGRASLLFGTHTHVQTADECVFEGGLGYLTDLGMTGPWPSVLGLDEKTVLQKFLTGMPQRFETSKNPVLLCGLICEIEEETGLATAVQRVRLDRW